MVHSGPRLREHARRMRRAPTRAEDRMWSWLRGRRFDGWKFRRQFPIGRYILDFYCPELMLAVELDGQHHAHGWTDDYDTQRSSDLHERGIDVLHIPNEDLIRDPVSVADAIHVAIADALQRQARKTPSSAFGTFFPRCGGGEGSR